MCIPLESKKPATKRAEEVTSYLQYIAFFHLAIIFTKFIIMIDIGAIFEVFIIIVLWSAWAGQNHCSCLFYIVYCLYKSIVVFIVFATRYQNGKPILGEDSKHKAIMFVWMISLIFYIIASYIAFLAYKEYKAIEQEQSGDVSFLGGQAERAQPVYGDDESQRLNQRRQGNQGNQNFNAFQGQGVRLG